MRIMIALTLLSCLIFPALSLADTYARVEVTALERSDPDNITLSGKRQVFGSFVETFNTDDADLGWEAGGNLAFGWDSRWGQFEAGVVYYGDWQTDETFISPSENIYLSPLAAYPQLTLFIFDSGDFNNAYAHTIDYSSSAWGLQFVRKQTIMNSKHMFLYGLNYLNLEEDFKWVGYDELNDFQGTDTDIGSYMIDTQNHLFGLVAGAEGNLVEVGDWFRIVYGVEGGLFANRATQYSELWVQDNYYASGSKSDWKLAYRLDGRLGLEFEFIKNVVFGLGVKGMWLEGVVLSPEQISFVTPAVVTSAQSAADAIVRYDNTLNTGDLAMYGAYFNVGITF